MTHRYTLAEMRAILGITPADPAEELFWQSMRSLAAAYCRSSHVPGALTISNLDSWCQARWDETRYTDLQVASYVFAAWELGK